MRPVSMNQHPLLRAMALLTRAKRTKADLAIIRNLERRVNAEATRVQGIFAAAGGIHAFAKDLLV